MNLFDVYPLFDITPIKAKGSFIWDDKGERYLDFYGGHAVISIGHTHPHYVKKITDQLNEIGFYSNAVNMPLQGELAQKLGEISGYPDYNLFLCNSGTEANENALKLASFHTGRKKVIAFKDSFHGRTSLSVGITDDPKISANINKVHEVVFVPLNDIAAFTKAIDDNTCAVIIEGIQGVGGINIPSTEFLKTLEAECRKKGALLILDEIQSGFGRTGKFFAHQHSFIKPDLITMAKGMGNGFPIAGVLINPGIKAKHGMLGTTFGGNHLACAASLAVLEVIQKENLLGNATSMGKYLIDSLKNIAGITKVKGTGLMIGIETAADATLIRKELLFKEKIFTGYSSINKTIRLLPPLNINKSEADIFLNSFKKIVSMQGIRTISNKSKMKRFTSVNDISSPSQLIQEAIRLKNNPHGFSNLGKNKMLGLIFLNPSLRTRLSTQKAAMNLGMQVIVMNIGQEGWALEFNDGAVMNGNKPEHIKDAAAVIGNYCDIIGVRCFPSLTDREEDYSEKVLLQFIKYCNKPFISLECATLHPLQSLADCITIEEHRASPTPPKEGLSLHRGLQYPPLGGRGAVKVVLTWAPHIKPLPQAVANSFAEWMNKSGVEFSIAQPKGYELAEEFVQRATVHYNQADALKNADFVYVKNWSSYKDYGQMPEVKEDWLLNSKKMKVTNNAYLMHCLPVRRNIEVPDELLDNNRSLILKQAENRVFAAQAVIKKMLETNYGSAASKISEETIKAIQ